MELRERLMEDIRLYPCIYDKHDKDYMDKTAKNNAWAAIAAKYGLTVTDADKKYKVVRSSFTRYLKKKRSTPPGIKPPPVPVGFANLDWLANHIDHKETAVRYSSNNVSVRDSYYGDYVADDDDAYHSSYDEIMREEDSAATEMIDLNNSHLTTRPQDDPKHAESMHAQAESNGKSSDDVPNQVIHVKESLQSEPLPPPILHVSTAEYAVSRTNSPPSAHVSSSQVSHINGQKSITMYYNKANGHEPKNDTVISLIPYESVQPGPTTSTPGMTEYFGKRKRVEYDDEDELFCLSLVPTLKRLGTRNKTIAKMRFQQVLFDLEFPSND